MVKVKGRVMVMVKVMVMGSGMGMGMGMVNKGKGHSVRGAIAKRLRRQAYGDMSLKEERTYKFLHKPVYPRDFQQPWGTIINVGKRRDYLNLKKEYKKGGDENRK